jgi:CheY-specific phosphatase CheX
MSEMQTGRRKATKMGDTGSHGKGYVLVALMGAVGGGLVVALVTKAIPKIMSNMMSGMMRNVMAQMGEAGCDPAEM